MVCHKFYNISLKIRKKEGKLFDYNEKLSTDGKL